MAVQPVLDPLFARPGAVLGDRERVDVSEAAEIQISGMRVVACVGSFPVVVWGQQHDSKCTAQPSRERFCS